MPQPPETRETLIQRLPNGADVEAWVCFVEIYQPLLFRLARAKGFQHADADDFVQEVLAAVARGVGRWVDNAGRGSFRTWLFCIAQNLAINFLARPKHQRLGTGDSQIEKLLSARPAPAPDSAELFVKEYRRELFRWAAAQVKRQVSDKQWQAYWQTSVEERPAAAVAEELGMSVGSIYIARCRIAKRLREALRDFEEPTP